jgi:hypothetical protein
MAVVEWQPDLSPGRLSTPRWFTGRSPGRRPFLQHFVDEARRFLTINRRCHGLGSVHRQSNSEELLLRARALKVDGRLVIVSSGWKARRISAPSCDRRQRAPITKR